MTDSFLALLLLLSLSVLVNVWAGVYDSNNDDSYSRAEKECLASAGRDDSAALDYGYYDFVATQQLDPWRDNGGISLQLLEQTWNGTSKHGSVRYQIIDNKVYRSPGQCKFPPRCSGVEHFLQEAAPKLDKNIQLVLNVNDYPLVHNYRNNDEEPLLPVFSFSKIPNLHSDILYPTWAFWEGGPWIKEISTWRWDQVRQTLLEAGAAKSWDEKQDVVFFRGSRTNENRDALLLYADAQDSNNATTVWDAKFTPNQSQRSTEYVRDVLKLEFAPHIEQIEQCGYRYLLNFDGVAASFRLRDVLACGSTVLYVNPAWMEFWYYKLEPWMHYIPIPPDGEGAQEVVTFLQAHPDLPRKIASNGRAFIQNHLTLQHVSRYWLRLLQEYATLQTFEPALDPTFIELS